MQQFTRLKILVSTLALLIAAIHVLRPDLSIDGVTVALLVLAALPWFSSLFKSIELPGGITLDLKDVEKLQEDATDAGLVTSKRTGRPRQYPFQALLPEDPNLALAGVRIELERVLELLASENGVHGQHKGTTGLIKKLQANDVLSKEEVAVLHDLIGFLNQAVHGAMIDDKTASWAMQTGLQILEALQAKK